MIEKQLYLPKPQGLYHPKNEKENCGVGFIANIKSKASYKITEDALKCFLAWAIAAHVVVKPTPVMEREF